MSKNRAVCDNCDQPLIYGMPYWLPSGSYWYHPHNQSVLCVLPLTAKPRR